MRNISFAMTVDQLRDGSKDVTRRFGWKHLKPGDQLCAIEKGMGLKRGESVRRLGVITVVDVRTEPLSAITQDDVVREGFPDMSVADFVVMFSCKMRCERDAPVRRIEFTFEPMPSESS